MKIFLNQNETHSNYICNTDIWPVGCRLQANVLTLPT